MTTNKKIGLVLKKPSSVFSNGCIQQAFFLYKLLCKSQHYEFELVTIESDYDNFEYVNVPVQKINLETDYTRYLAFVFTSGYISNAELLSLFTMHGITLINLICGNLLILHQEEYVFDVHNIMLCTRVLPVTENWMLPMYSFAQSYIEFMSETPTYITPYVWDKDILDIYQKEVMKETVVATGKENTEKINLMIFEPNISIHKTSLVPLLIAERFYKMYPNRLERVYHFCSGPGKNEAFKNTLTMCKDGRIEHLPRVIMSEAFKLVQNTGNPYLCVTLSHNIMNELNFLHLEMFVLGKPIVHNCRPFAANGLYYNTENLAEAVEHLAGIASGMPFDGNKHREQCSSILHEYSPENATSLATYEEHFTRVLETGVAKQKAEIHETMRENLRNATDAVATDAAAESRGLVSYVWDDESLARLCYGLTKIKHTLSFSQTPGLGMIEIEVFYNQDALSMCRVKEAIDATAICDTDVTVTWTSIQDVPEAEGLASWLFAEEKHVQALVVHHARFEKVLYVSPSVILMQIPQLYFSLSYLQTDGNVFWRSIKPHAEYTKSIPLFEFYCNNNNNNNNRFITDISTDMFLIDKKRCEDVLRAVVYMSRNTEYYYNHLSNPEMMWVIGFGFSSVADRKLIIIGEQPGVVGYIKQNENGNELIGTGITTWLKNHTISHFVMLTHPADAVDAEDAKRYAKPLYNCFGLVDAPNCCVVEKKQLRFTTNIRYIYVPEAIKPYFSQS